MAEVRSIVQLAEVKREVAAPLVAALTGKIPPAAIYLDNGESWWLPIRYVIAGLSTFMLPFVVAAAVDPRHHSHHDHFARIFAMSLFVWVPLWAWAGPLRQWWRKRRLPWKPGVYALGPHVIDVRSTRLRAFPLTGVTAELEGVRNLAEPCLVRVTSLWKTFTIRIPEPAAAASVRDQLEAGRTGDLGVRLLEPTLDRSARVKAHGTEPAAVPREPLLLRHAWISTLVMAIVLASIAVYVIDAV